MHILQTRLCSYKISSEKLHESLIQHISYNRPHIQHFLYFIPYIVITICMIYVIRFQHTPNLSLCINTGNYYQK